MTLDFVKLTELARVDSLVPFVIFKILSDLMPAIHLHLVVEETTSLAFQN